MTVVNSPVPRCQKQIDRLSGDCRQLLVRPQVRHDVTVSGVPEPLPNQINVAHISSSIRVRYTVQVENLALLLISDCPDISCDRGDVVVR